MKPTTTEKLDLSIRSAVGFSLVELMVVVTIIGALALIGVPRFRTMTARARQAEAKTNLEQIHKLNTLHQTAKDKYARWSETKGLGYPAGGGTRNCDLNAAVDATSGMCSGCNDSDNDGAKSESDCSAHNDSCTWTADKPGAKSLGFILSSCNSARYLYWIQYDVIDGKEHYHAVAYSPSDTNSRIYPTCDGSKLAGGNRNTLIKHPKDTTALNVGDKAKGDVQSISEDKIFGHSDIVPACE